MQAMMQPNMQATLLRMPPPGQALLPLLYACRPAWRATATATQAHHGVPPLLPSWPCHRYCHAGPRHGSCHGMQPQTPLCFSPCEVLLCEDMQCCYTRKQAGGQGCIIGCSGG